MANVELDPIYRTLLELALYGYDNLPTASDLGALCSANPALWTSDVLLDQVKAKAICHQCPHQALCLSRSIAQGDPWNIAGGLDPFERGIYKKVYGTPTGRGPIKELPEVMVRAHRKRIAAAIAKDAGAVAEAAA